MLICANGSAARLAARVPELLDRVQWLDHLPAAPLTGVLIANEVLDALPVERFTHAGRTNPVSSVCACADGEFAWSAVDRRRQRLKRRFATIERDIGAAVARWLQFGDLVCASRHGLARWQRCWAGVSRCSPTMAIRVVSTTTRSAPTGRWSATTGIIGMRIRFFCLVCRTSRPGSISVPLPSSRSAAGLGVAAYTTQAHFLLATGILQAMETEWRGIRASHRLRCRQWLQNSGSC